MNFIKTHKVQVALGGTALSVAVGYGIYHFLFQESSEDRAGIKILQRDVVIKLLKEMQKEFFSTFSSLAMIGMQIQQQSRNKIPPAELEYILSNQREFFIRNLNYWVFFRNFKLISTRKSPTSK